MVCLPTGLGKTLIATNVMYNYYRWFPSGIIIFLAPTKPLVFQQLNCLKRVKGIEKNDIAELTGSKSQKAREEEYKQKRILFMTPQTLKNDIEKEIFQISNIILIVYDEAHRASGKYAYSEINKLLKKRKQIYRVLALTATPGNDFEKIQKIVSNLSICRIEVREDSDPDVKKYLKEKEIEPIYIKQSEFQTELDISLSMLIVEILDELRRILPKEGKVIPQTAP